MCVGLETAADTLGAVIDVKRPTGYSGDLCEAGSKEYVAFGADWNDDGIFEEYLGTAHVEVHDLEGAMPGEGVPASRVSTHHRSARIFPSVADRHDHPAQSRNPK